jgi:hypothetical protein
MRHSTSCADRTLTMAILDIPFFLFKSIYALVLLLDANEYVSWPCHLKSTGRYWAKQQDIFSSFPLSQSYATIRKRPQLRVANPTKPIWKESRREFGNLVGGANPNSSFTYTVMRSFRQENDADEHEKYVHEKPY